MDDTIYGCIACFFLLYWLYVKDPEAPEDTKLDEQTRNNILLFTMLVGSYTIYKMYVTNCEGWTEFGRILTPSADTHESSAEGGLGGVSVKKTVDIPSGSVRVGNVSGMPHVLEGKNFFSSATTNNTEISAA